MRKESKQQDKLLERYKESCDKIVEFWLRKQDYVDDETGEPFDWDWFEIGSHFEMCDYHILFDDVLHDLKKNVPKGVYFEYYEHCLDFGMMGIKTPNYNSYLMGARGQLRNIRQHIFWEISRKARKLWWSVKDFIYYKERKEMKRKCEQFLEEHFD